MLIVLHLQQQNFLIITTFHKIKQWHLIQILQQQETTPSTIPPSKTPFFVGTTCMVPCTSWSLYHRFWFCCRSCRSSVQSAMYNCSFLPYLSNPSTCAKSLHNWMGAFQQPHQQSRMQCVSSLQKVHASFSTVVMMSIVVI